MARLVVRSGKLRDEVIELKLGVNRIGRSPANDFQLDDSTISTHHCEIVLGGDGIIVQDKGSANGTFLDGQRVHEARLEAGQILNLGNLALLVEKAEVTVAIPRIDVKLPPPPVTLADAPLLCPRHPRTHATHRCTHCHEVLCGTCLHRLQRRGGEPLLLCPLCSYQCELIGGQVRKKKSLFALLLETLKVPFNRTNSRAQ